MDLGEVCLQGIPILLLTEALLGLMKESYVTIVLLSVVLDQEKELWYYDVVVKQGSLGTHGPLGVALLEDTDAPRERSA